MKRLLLILLFTPVISFAQIAYYDAIELSKLNPQMVNDKLIFPISNNNNVSAAKILQKYTGGSNYGEIQMKISSNEFINLPFDASLSTNPINSISSFGNDISGLNVTNIVRGIASFMIDRAKKELTAAFFNRLQVYFENTPEIQVLFPKTSSALTGLLSYHYSEMLPTLRTNFHEDMKLLPLHFDDVLMLPKYKDLLADFPEIRIAIKTIRLISKLENEGLHPAEIITKFSEFPEWKDKQDAKGFQNFGNSLKIAAIFSQSLRYKDSTVTKVSTRAWVHAKDVLNLIENEIAFKIYLGLLYQQLNNKTIKFYKDDDSTQVLATTYMKNNTTTIFLFQNYISEFIEISEKLERKIKNISEINERGQKASKEDLYEYISLSINIVEYGTDVIKLFEIDASTAKEYISLARNSNDLFKNIYQENYSAGISNVVTLFEIITGILGENLEQKISSQYKSIDSINYNSSNFKAALKHPERFNKIKKAIISDITSIETKINNLKLSNDKKKDFKKLLELYKMKKSLDSLDGTIQFIRKYGLFIANMVQAKTAEEVQSVIEAAVLPVGSSSLKKHSNFNVSIQSYLGVSYNFSFKDNPTKAWEGKVNVTAPIGVSFSHGFDKGGSISAFISLIDIGAIVDYELKRDSTFTTSINASTMDTTIIATVKTKSDYKVELGQIFSPGLFLVYGAPYDLPLALMIGCQYGPGLINISSENTDIVKPSLRWMVSLTVDIPWFTLSNTSKTKIKKKKKKKS